MSEIKIKTAERVVPMIYCYTTPGIPYHNGYVKIGYTEQDVDTRIKQQTHTAGVKAKKEWQGTAIYDDGSGEAFKDHEFHAYLKRNDVQQPSDRNDTNFGDADKNEWFYVSPAASRTMFFDFKANHGKLEEDRKEAVEYILRDEQAEAVREATAYYKDHPGKEFLWNAKPRFGKTLSVYDFCKQIGAERVLILTNRPAIANSWYSDFMHFGFYDYYYFATNSPALKGKKYTVPSGSLVLRNSPFVEFESLQDLKGSVYFGGKFDKYKNISEIEWDLLVIDEAHEGVDTYKTDVALDHIKRKFTLHLSGTPFKALASDKFPSEAIFNWTYADEQRKKAEWADVTIDNPYANLPRLNMFTYQMSEIVKDEVKQGIDVDGETEEYAFDLNEFFRTNESGHFVHESAVDKFLDALTTQKKFPFSTDELRKELKHTLWLLNRVDSAKELAKKLKKHPVFNEYEIVVAAGDGRLDTDDTEHQKAFDKVVDAISKYDKTITLSVGQLTTGVTIPEWTAVLMLSNVESPSLYMQAAFRAQNPCLFHEGTEHFRKENAYVFDFDPARTLIIFEEFANDLSSDTAKGGGTSDQRKEHVRELLNFFPVLAEDDDGEMIELDAEKVLSIPRKIKSQEVVRRGFMSNFLFQNISGIFGAGKELMDILNNLQQYKEGKTVKPIDPEEISGLPVDENGDPVIPDETIVGTAADIFGEKIYKTEDVLDLVNAGTPDEESDEDEIDRKKEEVKKKVHTTYIAPLLQTAKETYGSDMKKSDTNALDRKLSFEADNAIDKAYTEYSIQMNTLDTEKKKELAESTSDATDAEIQKKYETLQQQANTDLAGTLQQIISTAVEEAPKKIVEHVEKAKVSRKRDDLMEEVRGRLRGFSRTIPSFLMAYGDDTVTLATFDEKVPGEVFVEVTSITLDQFRFLRDGGTYTDSETGEEKHFGGQLFDPIVFDDSVKEFLRLRQKLANYFDEKAIEDIFDYIPPQKTNQIFTPKDVVKRMVDMLEEENPGCFDSPDKTFIDLYMKSGLYITEIVKRLYQSEKLKKLYPDGEERLKHIFAKQVFGLAPTEIIYRISTNYILGFDEDTKIEKHNFRLADAVPYAKEGKLNELLDELYPDEEV